MRLGRLGAGDILFGWGKAVEKKAALPVNRYASKIFSCFMHEIFVLLFFFIAPGFAVSFPSAPAETVCPAGKTCGLNIEGNAGGYLEWWVGECTVSSGRAIVDVCWRTEQKNLTI